MESGVPWLLTWYSSCSKSSVLNAVAQSELRRNIEKKLSDSFIILQTVTHRTIVDKSYIYVYLIVHIVLIPMSSVITANILFWATRASVRISCQHLCDYLWADYLLFLKKREKFQYFIVLTINQKNNCSAAPGISLKSLSKHLTKEVLIDR